MKQILAACCILITMHVHAQNWLTTGNTGTTPGTHFIGNIDNKDLIFKTNNTEKFRIAASGDISLTSAPNGGAGVESSVFLSGHVYLAPHGNSDISYLQARRLNNLGTTELRIRTCDNGNLTNTMTLKGNGNIGIGTVWPKAKLHLTSTSNSDWNAGVPDNALLMIGGQDDQFEGQYINFKNPSTNPGSITYPDGQQIYWWSADILVGRFKNYAKWSFKENHGGSLGNSTKDILYAKLQDAGGYTSLEKIVLAPDAGSVSIGTDDAKGYKLAVNGSAIFTSAKVKLNQNWPDYVFAKDYQLLPLAELEKFIQRNNHLPEIPSATEVEKEGLDLGSNQATLLKKIEELTLYIIQQDKEMQQMKTEIKNLHQEVQQMKEKK